MMKTSKKGFSLVEIVIFLGVLVLVGALGYVGWRSFMASNSTNNAASSDPSKQSAEVITTKADLEAAEKALSDLNFEDESAAQAESQASL